MDEDTITRNNDLNIGIMKDESPERGILADSIAPINRLLINTKKKDSNAKGSTDREQPTSKKLRKIMICGRSKQECHVDDFTPNRRMGGKRKMVCG